MRVACVVQQLEDILLPGVSAWFLAEACPYGGGLLLYDGA